MRLGINYPIEPMMVRIMSFSIFSFGFNDECIQVLELPSDL